METAGLGQSEPPTREEKMKREEGGGREQKMEGDFIRKFAFDALKRTREQKGEAEKQRRQEKDTAEKGERREEQPGEQREIDDRSWAKPRKIEHSEVTPGSTTVCFCPCLPYSLLVFLSVLDLSLYIV